MMQRIRWGDNDRHLGPFTYARDGAYRPWAIVLGSGDGDEHPGCRLRVSGFGRTLIMALPPMIHPWRQWVDTSRYEWSRGPGSGFWDIHDREYGFSLSDGFLQVFLGPQTGDSRTTRSWSKFLPWTQWRHVRRSLYGLDGEHVLSEPQGVGYGSSEYEAFRLAEEASPARHFAFLDFDGERLTARTRIEEREWRFGEGWFKWLSVFREPLVKRSLDLWFSGETGSRKGSWKGGTLGHSIELRPGELHEAAFRRYCQEHEMTFLGPHQPQPEEAQP